MGAEVGFDVVVGTGFKFRNVGIDTPEPMSVSVAARLGAAYLGGEIQLSKYAGTLVQELRQLNVAARDRSGVVRHFVIDVTNSRRQMLAKP